MQDPATYAERIDLLLASIDCMSTSRRRLCIASFIENANRYNREGDEEMRRFLGALALLMADIRDDAERYDQAFDEIALCTRLDVHLEHPETWE